MIINGQQNGTSPLNESNYRKNMFLLQAQEVLKDFLDSLEEIEHIILKTDQAISGIRTYFI